MPVSAERLSDLLVDPREDLDLEIKNWLDLQSSNEDKATFAKAILALSNHGGGFVVLGLVEGAGRVAEADGRPATLDGYNQDLVNGIVQNYCDPHFHCEVHIVANPAGALFPVVVVPGGHRVPIRARRAGPNGNTVQNNAIYVRKPGPRSEVPLGAQEWDDLLARCLRNRRDEMFDQIRDLITGAVPRIDLPQEPDRLVEWARRSRQRWVVLIDNLPEDVGPRLPHGRYQVAYQIVGELRPINPARLPDVLRQSVVRHTGWPPFWYPTRDGIAPYPFDGTVECWIGGDPLAAPEQRDAAHSDFWRIDPAGFAFLLRGYDEDSANEVVPGTAFDVNLPIWRVGEALLHAESLARNLFEGPCTIKFGVRYEGLANRSLASIDHRRHIWDGRVCRQDVLDLAVHVDAQSIVANLPEVVQPLLAPLYGLFDFFEMPMQFVVEELARMRGR